MTWHVKIRAMRYVALCLAFLLATTGPSAFSAIEILIAPSDAKGSAAECKIYYLAVVNLLSERNSLDAVDHKKMLFVTKEQIYDTYRALGTVPESEIEALRAEDAKYPAQAVLYLRQVSDIDGSVQGIMRIVAGENGSPYYFNHFLSKTQPDFKGAAQVPVLTKYPDAEFQKFFREKFPKATEVGRVVFGKGVNEVRVLVDLTTAAASLSYLPSSAKDHYLVAEAVRPGIHRYSAMGMTQVPTPIAFNDGRVLMVIPMSQMHDRYIGNVKRAVAAFEALPYFDLQARREAVARAEQAVNQVSDNGAVQGLYSYGIYELARLHYVVNDFQAMLNDVRKIERRNPQDKDIRLLSLYAETGSRFNWVTGEGRLSEALKFLDSAAAKEKYDDVRFVDGLYVHNRLYVKGLVLLGAGKVAEARAVREEMDRLNQDKMNAAKQSGRMYGIVSPEVYGFMRVDGLREHVYDPETKKGRLDLALQSIDIAQQENPVGLSSHLHDYKARVLRDLGREPEAAAAQRIADQLRSPVVRSQQSIIRETRLD